MKRTTLPASMERGEDGTPAAEHPFDADTRVDTAASGGFAATISDRWNALGGGPNGGSLLCVRLRALGGELGFPDPLVVSAFFVRRAVPGPATVLIERARQRRRLATGESRLLQEGEETFRVVATFAENDDARGRTFVAAEPLDLPPPEQAADPLGGSSIPGVTIADRVEYRIAEPPGWSQGSPSGDPRTELWMRFPEPRDADLFALPLLVDAVAPAVLELGEPGSSTVELTVHLRWHPALGWLACRVATRNVIGGYHEDLEIWDSRPPGRSRASSRWCGPRCPRPTLKKKEASTMSEATAVEFDRQLENLLQKGYPRLAGATPEDFRRRLEPLRATASRLADLGDGVETRRIPFVIVVNGDLLSADQAVGLIERRGKAASSVLDPDDLQRFRPIETVELPRGSAYLVVDVDTGPDTRNVTPDDVLKRIEARGRSPLTIEEGIALVTHHPEAVAPNAGFSLPGSRCGDRRVAALWISKGRPKLGWCWAGNPHTWLGSASCARRVGP